MLEASIMLDSGFAPQLVLHFVHNTQQSESKGQSAIEVILLFFDFHKNQLTTFTFALVKYHSLKIDARLQWDTSRK